MNLQIAKLQQALRMNIRESELPVGVALLVIKDIENELNNLYNEVLQQQVQQLNETEEIKEQDAE